MSLSAANLAGSLQAFASPGGFPKTHQEAGQKWADALTNYWSSGLATFGAPTMSPGNKVILASTLGSIFASQQAGAASKIAAACTAFWLAPPIPWHGIWPGITTAVAGSGSLGPALEAVMQSNIASRASAAAACKAIANAIHAFSLTVTVTFTTNTGPVIRTMS